MRVLVPQRQLWGVPWWVVGSRVPPAPGGGVPPCRSLSVCLMEILDSVHICLAAAGRPLLLTHLVSPALIGDSFPAVLGAQSPGGHVGPGAGPLGAREAGLAFPMPSPSSELSL